MKNSNNLYRQQSYYPIVKEPQKPQKPYRRNQKKKAIELERREWTIIFTWIKAHAGNHGNEIADNLAKEATKNKGRMYNKMPKSQIVTTSETTEYRKVANTMGTNSKRINNKTIWKRKTN